MIVCQVMALHAGHRISRRGFPAAFHRMPPASHTDVFRPQGQHIIHARDSLSMLLAQELGTTLKMKDRREDMMHRIRVLEVG